MRRRTKRIPQQDYNSSAAPPWGMAPRATGDEIYERRDPHGRASLEANVIIPLATGLLFAVPAFLGLLLAKVDLRYAAAGALVTFTVAAALMLAKMLDLMAKVETWTRLDLDGDGIIGPPPTTVRVEVKEQQPAGWRMVYADLPIDDPTMRQVADAILVKKQPYSRRALSDILTQTQYEALSDAMIKAGLLIELPGQRRELTGAGRSLMRQIV